MNWYDKAKKNHFNGKDPYEVTDFNQEIKEAFDWLCITVNPNDEKKTMEMSVKMKNQESIKIIILMLAKDEDLFNHVMQGIVTYNQMKTSEN